ncbi:hypothetical protein ANRL3_00164 [Anaerolineae bacterium]|nr:hypothetical protein ANRL3_00164 [Anaerolineae bacterium]
MKKTSPSNPKSYIPRTLAPAFPEYRLRDLDAHRDAAIIIERTLEHGTRRELQWLFRRYSRARIQNFVRAVGMRRLSKRAFNYWRLILNVSHFHHAPFQDLRDMLWGR